MKQRLGIDLRILQVGHQYRGIGEQAKHILNHFPTSAGFDDVDFVFYTFSDLEDPTAHIKSALRKYPRFTVETIGRSPRPLASNVYNYLSRVNYDYQNTNEERLAEADVDAMLFLDFQLGIPASAPYRKTLFMYDLIPMLFPDQYHPTFRAGRRQGMGIRAAGTDAYRNWVYSRQLSRGVQHADAILTNSDNTKEDIITHLGVAEQKVQTALLGVEPPSASLDLSGSLKGFNAKNDAVQLDPFDESYIFYIGGSDFRRRIPHMFDAFEIAKKSNPSLKMVLAGADFQSVDLVREADFKKALGDSEHAEDILFFGYVNDVERTALYRQARAFVYPTLYEGFGLPILEAMACECPVITYKNSSTAEVGGDAALYASDTPELASMIERLAVDTQSRDSHIQEGLQQAKKFTWAHTAQTTLDVALGKTALVGAGNL